MKQMKMRAAIAIAAMAGILTGCEDERVTLHVAPDGDDGNAGTCRCRPLRTLAGARDAVRRIQGAARTKPLRAIEVVFEDGVYAVPSAVTFGAEDAAKLGQAITYRAAHRGKAVFDGGMTLDWKPVDKGDPAAARIPSAVIGRVKVATIPPSQELPDISGGRCYPNLFPVWLYEGGKPAPIAAWPDASDDWGDLYREFADAAYDPEILAFNKKDHTKMRFICREKERVAAWLKEPELKVYGLWYVLWDDTHAKILDADSKTGLVTLDATTIPVGYTINWEGHRYRVLNALCEMDKPGEWAIDRARRRIYRVDDGTTPVMSATKACIEAEGVSGVTFDGLSFRHMRGTALTLRDCRDVRVRGCTMQACGGWAAKVLGGRDCRVEGCDIRHVGEGGILLRGGDRATLTHCNHAAVNNHIHHYGERLPMYRTAIRTGRDGESEKAGLDYSCGVSIEHNLIHHGRHIGIGFVGNDIDIRWNMIHDVCACSRDCGAIYGYNDKDWALSRGTRIENNCIYKTGRKPSSEGLFFVIYLDGFVSGVTVRENIVVGGDIGLFHQGGHANVFEKNVVAGCGRGARRMNLGGTSGHTLASGPLWRNLQRDKALFQSEPWASAYPELAAQSKMTDPVLAQSTMAVVFRDNVFGASGTCFWHDDKKLGKYNTVSGNLVEEGDPGFVDYEHYNFNLKTDSKAYALVGDLGFNRMGLTNGPDRASAAVRFGEGITKPAKLEVPSGPAAVSMLVWYYGAEKFTKEKPMVTNLVNCSLPKWNPAGNLVATKAKKLAKDGKWIDYEFSFTPTISGPMTLELAGSQIFRTCLDDMRATGTTIKNGGFEEKGGWSTPVPNGKLVDLRQFGIRASEGPNQAPEGTHFIVVNEDARISQNIKVEAGKRVTFKCRAAAWR